MASFSNAESKRGGFGGVASAAGPVFWKGLRLGVEHYGRRSKDTTAGNPQPSLKLQGPDRFMFRVPVDSGSRTLGIDVQFSPNVSPYPKMTVLANPAVGLNSDSSASASAGTGVQTLSVSWTASAAGAVWVMLEITLKQPDAVANFDNFTYN